MVDCFRLFLLINFSSSPVYYNFFNAAKLTVSLIFCLTFFSETIGQTKRSKEELLKALDDARNDNELLDVKIELAMEYFEVDNILFCYEMLKKHLIWLLRLETHPR